MACLIARQTAWPDGVFDYTAERRGLMACLITRAEADPMHAAGGCFGADRALATGTFDEQLDPTGMPSAREITTEADRTQAIGV